MVMFGTLAVLAAWLAFVWIFDPDGFRDTRTAHAASRARGHHVGRNPEPR